VGRRDVERELAFAEAKVESLTEQLRVVQDEKLELKAQIDKLQDALISVRAPAAYLDQQEEKFIARQPKPDPEEVERSRVLKQVTEAHLANMEGALIRTPEDLDDLLVSGILSETEPSTSLHGNNES
jgi:predicted  nucleic acid-binding Zn-ribbon protein